MSHDAPTIRADFQNADSAGRIRLNTAGALADLAGLRQPLSEGAKVQLVDADLTASGAVTFDAETGIWTAVIDWHGVQSQQARDGE